MVLRILIPVVSLLLTASVLVRADEPPIFAKVAFADAVAATKASDKLLVVKFTAAWCGPCKQMDKTTWRDDQVVKWFERHGTVIAVDVDKEPRIAADNRIRAMPTMVAFKGGSEAARRVGYMSAKDVLQWTESVRTGALIEAHAAANNKGDAGAGKQSMQERLQAARVLVDDGKLEKATDEYVWLWKHMLEQEPAMMGVRGSYMASEMQDLAARHEPAKARFTALRDEAEARLKGKDKTFDDLTDWIVLNEVLADDERTLAWFDRIKDEPDVGTTLDRSCHKLTRLLEKHERWADLGRVNRHPLAVVRQQHQTVSMLESMQSAEEPEEYRDMVRQLFNDEAGKQYLGQLALGRDDVAQRVADEAIKLKDSPQLRRTLVEWALKGRQPRESQRMLLEGGEHAVVRERLEAALKAR